jgi:stage II sporulation protein D
MTAATLALRALFVLSPFPTLAAAQLEIRVLLAELTSPIEIAMPEAHRGYLDGLPAFEAAFGLAWPLEAKGSEIYIDGLPVGRVLRLEPLGESLITWRGQPYRGGFEVQAEGTILKVMNVVDLEDYLRGVVPAEMPPNWPLEALKAQAVAARSYVLAAQGDDSRYDICATVSCQVYRGASAEHSRTDEAILATRGLVLGYGGGIARAHYHSHSGGYLASSFEVWGHSRSYLQARADIASPPPHDRWETALDPSMIAGLLLEMDLDIGPVHALEVLDYTASGRVYRARFRGERGQAVLEGPRLTSLLRASGLKSTRFTMRAPLVAEGGGYGHGVGMSQYGAYTLAQRGQPFAEILQFYYPGTHLERLPFEQAQQGN